MIILAVVLLSISCILLARGVYKLQKKVKDLHNETNNRVSQYYIETNNKFERDVNELNYLVRELQSNIDENETDIISLLDSRLDKLETKLKGLIPATNQEVLKEVQQMRDDFFALRQNF